MKEINNRFGFRFLIVLGTWSLLMITMMYSAGDVFKPTNKDEELMLRTNPLLYMTIQEAKMHTEISEKR